MNPLTEDHLANLWAREEATLAERYAKHLDAVVKMDLTTTGVIGRDLLVRKQRLFSPKFYLAAFLATESETGHNGFLDFTDSVAILPADRYDAITSNPDLLIDDPISRSHLINITCTLYKVYNDYGWTSPTSNGTSSKPSFHPIQ